MSNKPSFFFAEAKEELTRDQVIQILNKCMQAFASHNNITEDQARELLVRAEASTVAQESKETDLFKFNDLVFSIAQDMIDHKDDHICESKTPPTSPIVKTRRESI